MADERPQYQHGVGTIGGSQFHWGSGEPGKYWSIPYGDYPVTPNAPTGAWAQQAGAIPLANNVIPDPLLGRNRIGIMIHSGSASSLDALYTQGCFKVAPQEWPAVRSEILKEAADGPLYLHVQPGGAASFTNTKTLEQASMPTANAPGPPARPATTLNSAPPQGSSVLDTMRQNIGQYESGNNYNILGKHTNTGDYAVGKYQVMASNVPSWTQKWLGKSMTPAEFRANPQAQDAVFNGEFGSYLQTYSPADASSKWFTGQPLAQGANKRDILGTSGARYVQATIKGIDNPYAVTPGTTINAAGGPTTPAGGSTAPAAPGQPAQAAGGLAGQLATALKPLTPAGGKGAGGDGGQADEPPPMQLPQAPPARAAGGPMMIGPGGQNTMGERVAEQDLAQRGFSMQPQLASYYGGLGAARPPVATMMPGQATGIPAMPGTTLNSPSQLQMALMTGSMSPYDMYANSAAYGGGFGSS